MSTIEERVLDLERRAAKSDKKHEKTKRRLKDVQGRLKAAQTRIRSLEKELAKIKFRDLLNAFRLSLVKTFAGSIPCRNQSDDSPAARLKFWSKRDRAEEFIDNLVRMASSGGRNNPVAALITQISDDKAKFLRVIDLCRSKVKEEYDKLAHALDILGSEVSREQFDTDAAKKVAADLSTDIEESAVAMVDYLTSETMVWPVESSSDLGQSVRKKPKISH
jgi:septal ring factor EnvC (AmiA/AmiB activator)